MNNALDFSLFKRPSGYIPRIAAVHDLCGYGKCSLGVAIPVLSAAGCDVCPVPTSLFSAHTRFPSFYMHDTTDMLEPYLDAWVEEGIELDAIYSGFLGAAEQVEAILRLYREHPKALRIVDPVMGDAGARYLTYTEELCQAMAQLVDGADVLTPNLTEASILTGIPYAGQDVDVAYVQALMDKLAKMGARYIVIKGVVHEGEQIIRNYIGGDGIELTEISSELLPYMLHGTGDLYCSALLAALMAEKTLYDSVGFAGDFVRDAMKITQLQPDYEVRGVSFETKLGEITALLT